MPGIYACSTLFFFVDPEVLAEQYEAMLEIPNGYLIRMGEAWMLVDAQASETADWALQLQLATELSRDDGCALSLFAVGEAWALGIAANGVRGPVAVSAPDDEQKMDHLPFNLLALEQALGHQFPENVDVSEVDLLFGKLLDGGATIDETITALLVMLGCPTDWLRWSWFETVPQQLFLDPDFEDRVIPLGVARHFWEE